MAGLVPAIHDLFAAVEQENRGCPHDEDLVARMERGESEAVRGSPALRFAPCGYELCYAHAMTGKIEKRPGPDWDIFYMDIHGGSTECMSVFGCSTPEEAIAEARSSLTFSCETEEEKDWFEILAVVRQGVDLDAQSSTS